ARYTSEHDALAPFAALKIPGGDLHGHRPHDFVHHTHDGQGAVGIPYELEADPGHAQLHQLLQKLRRSMAQMEGRNQDLLLLKQVELLTDRGTYLDDEVALAVQLRGRVDDCRAGLGVFAVRKMRLGAG